MLNSYIKSILYLWVVKKLTMMMDLTCTIEFSLIVSKQKLCRGCKNHKLADSAENFYDNDALIYDQAQHFMQPHCHPIHALGSHASKRGQCILNEAQTYHAHLHHNTRVNILSWNFIAIVQRVKKNGNRGLWIGMNAHTHTHTHTNSYIHPSKLFWLMMINN